jgi:large subunit ribosomal protein L29
MKQDIVKDLTTEEIREKIAQERAMYTKLKMSHAVSPIENPMKIRASRRAIARLETEYRKRVSVQQQTK